MSGQLLPMGGMSLTSAPPSTSRALDRAGKSAMNAGSLRILNDNIEAAVSNNHMGNTAQLYYEAVSLAGDDPGLQQLLGLQVKQYAVKRA